MFDQLPKLVLGIAIGLLAMLVRPVPAEENRPPRVAISASSSEHPIHRESSADQPAAATSGPWWFGPTGALLLIVALGGVAWAARRFNLLPERDAGLLEVLGRVSLSSRHSVYAVRAGGRVLIVGTGPSGAPAFLADVTDAESVEVLPPAPASSGPSVVIPRPGGVT